MSTEIIIPKEPFYKLDEGKYRSQVQGVTFRKAKNSSNQNCVINFEVQVPGKERYECCARAVFPLDLKPGSQLRTFLERLLGTEFFEENSGKPVNLNDALRNLDCEIELVHGPHDESRYDWPLVLVAEAKPIQSVKETKEETK